MNAVTTETARPQPRGAAFADRAFAVIPAALAAIGVLTLAFAEAWLHKSPWVFTDEIEWTQISRSIAHTGHGAILGHPVGFRSLYAYLIAPCWWIHSVGAAYDAVKYLNAIVMTLADDFGWHNLADRMGTVVWYSLHLNGRPDDADQPEVALP